MAKKNVAHCPYKNFGVYRVGARRREGNTPQYCQNLRSLATGTTIWVGNKEIATLGDSYIIDIRAFCAHTNAHSQKALESSLMLISILKIIIACHGLYSYDQIRIPHI